MSIKSKYLNFGSQLSHIFPSACLIFITVIYKDITKEKERRILKRNHYITLLKKSISSSEGLGAGKASWHPSGHGLGSE